MLRKRVFDLRTFSSLKIVQTLVTYRKRLIGWLREDGYELPLDGNKWRDFPAPIEPENPDAGRLFQDGRSVSDQFSQGYLPNVDTLRR